MPEGVVYDLEVVQVHKQKRNLALPSPPGAPQGLPEAIHEKEPVRQVGEGVVEGLMLQLLFEGLALGYVSRDALDRHQLSCRIIDGLVALLGPDHRTILAQPANGDWGLRAAQHLVDEVSVVWVHDLEAQLGVGVMLLGGVADHGGGRRTDVLEAGRGFEPVAEDQVLSILGKEPEALLAATQLFCLRDVRDVHGNPADGYEVTLLVVHGSVSDHGGKSSSVLSTYHELP